MSYSDFDPNQYCDSEDFYDSLPEDPNVLDDYLFTLRSSKPLDYSKPFVMPTIEWTEVSKKIPKKLEIKSYNYYDLLYDFPKLEKEYIKNLKRILSKINYKSVAKQLLEELDPPCYYCEGETYHDINNIKWNKDIENYFRKIQTMQFSKGEYLNLENKAFYAKLLYAFQCHLDNLKNSYIDCKGWNSRTGEAFELKLELQYRNSIKYKNRSIARAYALMNAIKKLPEEKQKVTMVTFTTYQRDSEGRALDYRKQVTKLQENVAKLHDLLRKNYPGVPYMHVIESHQSGYLHVHRLYGCDISKEHQEKYKRLWESYGAGSYEHGLNFAYSTYDSYYNTHDKTEKSKEYKPYESAFLYAIKYISKSISEKGTAPFHEFVTDAVIWFMSKRKNRNYKGIRSFYISPNWNKLISAEFSKSSKVESVIIWELITLHYKDIEIVIYDANSIPPLETFQRPSQDFSPPACTA